MNIEVLVDCLLNSISFETMGPITLSENTSKEAKRLGSKIRGETGDL